MHKYLTFLLHLEVIFCCAVAHLNSCKFMDAERNWFELLGHSSKKLKITCIGMNIKVFIKVCRVQ